jgi:transposase-like protein
MLPCTPSNDAITAAFPQTQVQTCIVHLLRNSLEFVSWKDYKPVTQALRQIYRAENAEMARQRLAEFADSDWGRKYPTIAPLWRRHWEQVIPFLTYPVEMRRAIYTNALESVYMRLRKIIKSRGHFPNDEAYVQYLPRTALAYGKMRQPVHKWSHYTSASIPGRACRTAQAHVRVPLMDSDNP